MKMTILKREKITRAILEQVETQLKKDSSEKGKNEKGQISKGKT